jgi:hypothetical protein
MGNQMFQYAAAAGYAQKWNAKVELDTSLLATRSKSENAVHRDFELASLFSGPFNHANHLTCSKLYPRTELTRDRILSKLMRSLAPGELRIQEGFLPLHDGAPAKKLVGLVGRFQSQEYFKGFEQQVREAFQFKLEWPEESLWLRELARQNTTIGIHVRRGDYVSHPVYSKTLGFVGEDYLTKSMRLAEERLGTKPTFLVFSDDHEWCESFFGKDVQIVKHSFFMNPAHSDFMLLTQFQNLIISNSTFAWWAAKLSEPRSSLIIAPKKWAAAGAFDKSIVPDNWLSL